MFNASSLSSLSLTVDVLKHDLQNLIFSSHTPPSRPDILMVVAPPRRDICPWIRAYLPLVSRLPA